MVDTQIATLMAMAISYNWLFLWDYIYIFYKWGFDSTYN